MKYRSGTGTRVREVNPYAVDVYEGIQYLVGYDFYREEIRHFRPTRIEWVEMTDETFRPPSDFDSGTYLAAQLQSREGDTACFIATAAYGTPQADQIDRLRTIRDEILLQMPVGRYLVRAYYWCSPPIARWVARSDRRRRLVRALVIRPLLRLATSITTHHPEDAD